MQRESSVILVTGGAGFIGGHFIRQWLSEVDGNIINYDKLTYAGTLQSLQDVQHDPRYRFIKGDIADISLLAPVLKEFVPTAIVNLAAETHVDRSIDDPTSFVMTNVVGIFQLLEAVRHFWEGLPKERKEGFRFVQVSTDEVYGSLCAKGSFTENSPYAPNSPYSASKAAADHFVHAYHRTYGLPTIITNCSNNYGAFQFPEKLVPLMILNALGRKPMPVYGNGQNVRDWIHVEDHCRAIRAVLVRGQIGQSYNIGANCERTNLEIVEAICDAVDRNFPDKPRQACRSLIRFVADRPGHDLRYAVDSTKLRSELGWKPRIEFAAGLEQTIEWYRNHAEWVSRAAQENYRRVRIGESGKEGDMHLGLGRGAIPSPRVE